MDSQPKNEPEIVGILTRYDEISQELYSIKMMLQALLTRVVGDQTEAATPSAETPEEPGYIGQLRMCASRCRQLQSETRELLEKLESAL